MKKNDPRVPKDAARMFRDLVDHAGNLLAAMARTEAGDSGAYKDVLMNLRTLIGKKADADYNGLLFVMAALYEFELVTQVLRLRPNADRSGLDEGVESISLGAYLDRESANAGVGFTNGDFI